jgi:hypothetical protein
VAAVNSKGVITAKGTGKATIITRITLYNGQTKSFKTMVTVKKPYIAFSKSTVKMKTGESFIFELTAYGLEISDIKWSTKMRSILVINKKTGKATAVSKGTDYVIVRTGKKVIKLKVVVE